MMTPSRGWNVGMVLSVPFPKSVSDRYGSVLDSLAREAYDLKAARDTGNESCIYFETCWLVQAHRGSLLRDFPALHPAQPPALRLCSGQASDLPSLLHYVRAVETAADAHLQALQAEIDEAVYGLYEISAEDRALIRRELGERPPELVLPFPRFCAILYRVYRLYRL
jgi:hypothetical protein